MDPFGCVIINKIHVLRMLRGQIITLTFTEVLPFEGGNSELCMRYGPLIYSILVGKY